MRECHSRKSERAVHLAFLWVFLSVGVACRYTESFYTNLFLLDSHHCILAVVAGTSEVAPCASSIEPPDRKSDG